MKNYDVTGAAWRKSSRSNGEANCVEVACLADGSTAFRDSKEGDSGSVLVLASVNWALFTTP